MKVQTRAAGFTLGALLAIAAAWPESARAEDAKPYWRVDSGRLIVIANGSAQRCQRLAASIVRFEQLLFELAGWEPDASLTPLRFYSLDRADARRVLLTDADRERQKKGGIIVHSKYLPAADFDVAAIADIGGDEPLQSVLYLYGQGQLQQGPTRMYPAWFQLGVAELLNGLAIKADGTLLIHRNPGAAAPERARRAGLTFDLAKLLAAQPDAFAPEEIGELRSNAREWAVFGLLTSAERRRQFHELALVMRQGASPEDAMLEAFGRPLADVAAEFENGAWRKEARFRLPPAAASPAAPAASPIEPGQIEALLQIVAERAQAPEEQ